MLWELYIRTSAAGKDVNSGADLQDALRAKPEFATLWGGTPDESDDVRARSGQALGNELSAGRLRVLPGRAQAAGHLQHQHRRRRHPQPPSNSRWFSEPVDWTLASDASGTSRF